MAPMNQQAVPTEQTLPADARRMPASCCCCCGLHAPLPAVALKQTNRGAHRSWKGDSGTGPTKAAVAAAGAVLEAANI